MYSMTIWASQMALVVKNPPANVGDIRDKGLILKVRKIPRGWHGNPLLFLPEFHGQKSPAGGP